jgi:hypothetical protein
MSQPCDPKDRYSPQQLAKAAGFLESQPGAARLLVAAVELQNRLLLGQFHSAAQCVAEIARVVPEQDPQCGPELRNKLMALVDYLNTVPEPRGTSTEHFAPSYAAFNAACVLRCDTPDCATRACWVTRGWGCGNESP